MNARPLFCVAALVGLFPLANASSLLDGLVDHYDFNGSLVDSTGNGYNMTGSGVYEYVPDRFGVADGAVKLEDHNPATGTFFLGIGPDLANQSSSVSFWLRKDDVTAGSWVFGLGHPVGVGGDSGQDMHAYVDYSAPVGYSFFNDDLNTSTPLLDATWYNLTFTFDDATSLRSIYIDGSLVQSDYAAYPFTGGDNLKMGFDGISLDDFRFYNRALTADEVGLLAGVSNVPDAGMTALYLGMGVIGGSFFGRKKIVLANNP